MNVGFSYFDFQNKVCVSTLEGLEVGNPCANKHFGVGAHGLPQ